MWNWSTAKNRGINIFALFLRYSINRAEKNGHKHINLIVSETCLICLLHSSNLNILPACWAEWPTLPLGLLAQAQPPPPSVLLLPWHFPYSQGTRVPHPAGGFSHTSVPCFPIPLYYRGKRNGLFARVMCSSLHWHFIIQQWTVNSCTHVRTII